MVDDQNETTNEPGLVARQAAPRPLLLRFLMLRAFASRSCSFLLLLNHVSLSPAVELEWLVRVFGGFREFNVAFFQKPPELPRRSPPPKVCLFWIQYIPPHRKTDLSFLFSSYCQFLD